MIPFYRAKPREAPSMRNGRLVLEESIKLFNGRVNPIRSFALKELEQATNNFHEARTMGDHHLSFTWYKGFLQDRPVIIKKYKQFYSSFSFKEIAISSQMSSHNNVLKLLGCCLETDTPILVFEFAENGTLEDHISSDPNSDRFRPLLWKQRLKIAAEVASAVAYLHTAFPRPIVHRCLKTSNIFLADGYVAKLSDFSLSEPIPEGETHIPDTFMPGRFSNVQSQLSNVFFEKSDVYCFGVILLVLLTGRKVAPTVFGEYEIKGVVEEAIRSRNLREKVDPIIVEEAPWPGKEQQLEAFAMSALKCTDTFDNERPTITEVAKQIAIMYELVSSTPS